MSGRRRGGRWSAREEAVRAAAPSASWRNNHKSRTRCLRIASGCIGARAILRFSDCERRRILCVAHAMAIAHARIEAGAGPRPSHGVLVGVIETWECFPSAPPTRRRGMRRWGDERDCLLGAHARGLPPTPIRARAHQGASRSRKPNARARTPPSEVRRGWIAQGLHAEGGPRLSRRIEGRVSVAFAAGRSARCGSAPRRSSRGCRDRPCGRSLRRRRRRHCRAPRRRAPRRAAAR